MVNDARSVWSEPSGFKLCCSVELWNERNKLLAFTVPFATLLWLVILRASCGTAYCNRSCLWVCVCVCASPLIVTAMVHLQSVLWSEDKTVHWPPKCFYGPETKQSTDLQSVLRSGDKNSPLTSRLATVLLWLLTQALNWLNRGREWKYSTASSADNFSTVPSTRTYEKHMQVHRFIYFSTS